jgi:hypothetical protein
MRRAASTEFFNYKIWNKRFAYVLPVEKVMKMISRIKLKSLILTTV